MKKWISLHFPGRRTTDPSSPRRKGRYKQWVHKYQDVEKQDGYYLSYIVLPLLLVYVIECFARHSLLGGLQFLVTHPFPYLINACIITTSLTVALAFRKRIGVIILISFFWLFCGIANGIVLIFRVTPLSGSDLSLWKDGIDIASRYMNIWGFLLIGLLILIVSTFFVTLFFQTPHAEKKPAYFRSVTAMIVSFFITWGAVIAGQQATLLETEFRELSVSYKNNGFLYCFGASLIDTGISKPKDYSEETIEQLTEHYETQGETEDPEQIVYAHKPNVVIVQLESFFDVNRLKDVVFSENPLPNFTKLYRECASGAFSVPVIGAGTVNSEFEVLTGMNIDDFGIGEYPFKTIVKEKPCESIAYDLKAHDYFTFAIHNHEGTFYERNMVYPNLGFDVFSSVEYMWPEQYTALDWTKDTVLIDQIRKALDSTPAQDLVYAVSVQGHGSYPTDPETEYQKHITVTGSEDLSEEYLNQIQYYVNQLYETDRFIGELTKMLSERPESTILVLYGDHCPSLELTDDMLTSGTVYDTEYIIWNNAGLALESGPIEAYELSSIVLEALEITDGAVNTYHQNSRRAVRSHEMTEEDYLLGLQGLEYDILYGDQIAYNGKSPYEPAELQMGFYPITVTDVRLTRDSVLILTGENFTRYSSICIDGNAIDTLYISPEMLVAADVTIEQDCLITVSQSGLSETEPYSFRID